MAHITNGGILYYTVCVADLGRSVKWYSEKLGFNIASKRGSNQSQKVIFITNHGMTLKLVQVTNPARLPSYRSHPATDNAVRGNKHFSFRIDNGAQTEKEIRALKIPIVAAPTVDET
jgi:catechol 2,3-dioxygenase-like lactoylglutathione lyase family enzyme